VGATRAGHSRLWSAQEAHFSASSDDARLTIPPLKRTGKD
jgi:hypothetical protein